jgi:hypothetical protein
VKLHVKLLSFSWENEFKVLRGGPFPAILGLDFMDRARLLVDVISQEFSFGFSPNCRGTFTLENLDVGDEVYTHHLCEEALKMALVSEVWPSDVKFEFPCRRVSAVVFIYSRDG